MVLMSVLALCDLHMNRTGKRLSEYVHAWL